MLAWIVQKYNQLMRDFPIDELLSATSLKKVRMLPLGYFSIIARSYASVLTRSVERFHSWKLSLLIWIYKSTAYSVGVD